MILYTQNGLVMQKVKPPWSVSKVISTLFQQMDGVALEDINADTYAQYAMQW